jgi:hypothetical protein
MRRPGTHTFVSSPLFNIPHTSRSEIRNIAATSFTLNKIGVTNADVSRNLLPDISRHRFFLSLGLKGRRGRTD